MLKINLAKFDKFYLIFFLTASLLAILVIFTFKNIFSVFNLSYEMGEAASETNLRIDKQKLDEAYDFVYHKKKLPLESKEEEVR